MPYLQANTSNSFGFQPVEGGWSVPTVGQYTVSTSFGSAIFPGDILTVTTSAGFLQVYTSASANPVVGVAAQGCGASLTSATKLLVYNSPHQMYVGLKSTAEVTGIIGQFVNVLTSVAGSATRNRSNQMIGGAPSLSSTSGILKVVGINPIEAEDGSTGIPANRKLNVMIGLHAFAGQFLTTS